MLGLDSLSGSHDEMRSFRGRVVEIAPEAWGTGREPQRQEELVWKRELAWRGSWLAGGAGLEGAAELSGVCLSPFTGSPKVPRSCPLSTVHHLSWIGKSPRSDWGLCLNVFQNY